MAAELELTLELTPGAADLLEASSLLPGDSDIAEQRSVYFDTPDHALAKAGLSLHIRRLGRKRTQKIKADGASAAGLFAWSEWERPVHNDTPIPEDTTSIRALLGDAVDRVSAAFEVRIERRSWIITDSDATIERWKTAARNGCRRLSGERRSENRCG